MRNTGMVRFFSFSCTGRRRLHFQLTLSFLLPSTHPSRSSHLRCSTGSSVICGINRVSIYILLSISINLCALMFKITITTYSRQRIRKWNLFKVDALSTFISAVLPIVGYSLDGELDGGGNNANLNEARHSFSCFMR
jgi:hypothetical protein